MTTCLGKSCSFGLPGVPFVNCCRLCILVVSLLVLRAGCGIWLYQFLIIAYLFTLRTMFFFTLLRSGDVHPHPGPNCKSNTNSAPSGDQPSQQKTMLCVTCGKGVIKSSKVVDCDLCSRWTHIKRTGIITEDMYQELITSDTQAFSFICSKCSVNSLPFSSEESIDISPPDDFCDKISGPKDADPGHFNCFDRKRLHFMHLNVRSLI